MKGHLKAYTCGESPKMRAHFRDGPIRAFALRRQNYFSQTSKCRGTFAEFCCYFVPSIRVRILEIVFRQFFQCRPFSLIFVKLLPVTVFTLSKNLVLDRPLPLEPSTFQSSHPSTDCHHFYHMAYVT